MTLGLFISYLLIFGLALALRKWHKNALLWICYAGFVILWFIYQSMDYTTSQIIIQIATPSLLGLTMPEIIELFKTLVQKPDLCFLIIIGLFSLFVTSSIEFTLYSIAIILIFTAISGLILKIYRFWSRL
ncbi:MAG: hypothetical protein QMD50_03610 [Patescibacteria group bacterium]|nr:hypothetical protein [Patescibacteria group bacterium]